MEKEKNFIRVMVFCLAIVFLFAAAGVKNAGAGLNDGLVAYYPFDNNMDDMSGFEYDGTEVTEDTLSYDQGVFGKAASFDQTIVSLGKTLAEMGITDEITLSLWFYNKGSGKYFRLYSDHGGSNNTPYYPTFQNHGANSSTDFTVYAGGRNPGLLGHSGTITAFEENAWHFLTVTYDGSIAVVYKNGEELERFNASGNLGAGDFGFGAAPDNDTNDYYFFNGLIDEVRIFNRVLSECEVRQLVGVNVPDNNTGLVAYYPFDGGCADDASGNENSAFYFNGVNNYIQIDTGIFNGLTEITTAAWIKFNHIPSEPYELQTVISSLKSGSHHYWSLMIGKGETEDTEGLYLIANDRVFFVSKEVFDYQVDEFYHIAVTKNNSGNIKFFLNGLDTTISGTSVPGGILSNTSGTTAIGAQDPLGALPSRPFHGVIDEVRIYNSALSADKIAELAALTDTNQPPVLGSIDNKTVDEGATLEFTIAAEDPDTGDSLTYSASNLPDGANFDDGTQTFTWTPTFDQSGDHADVHFEVTDGSSNVAEDITITVNNINRPPVIEEIGNKTVDEGATLEFTIAAEDPDTGDSLTYSASNLPDGANFDDGTQTFTWTPRYDDSVIYVGCLFEVTDSDLADSETITITVVDRPAQGILGDVEGILTGLLPTGDRKTDKDIEKAIKHIKKCLDPNLWGTESTLTDKGKKVFDEAKKAVKKLMKIKNPPAAVSETISEVIELVIYVSQELASTAIDEVIAMMGDAGCSGGGNNNPGCDKAQKEIGKCQKEMAKAEAESSKGKNDKAIDHYKKAWEHSCHAIKHAGKGGRPGKKGTSVNK